MLGNYIAWGSNMYFFHTFGHYYKAHSNCDKIPTNVNFALAFVAGLIPIIITNPIWVIKVRMCMTTDPLAYSSLRSSINQIYRYEGKLGFFKV
ncbi:hypothetical protein MXB_3879 [Myxobolus squamalis]|nr:hypothetical protein MXB_3879 [Myxobolus squamalis]